MTEQKLDFINRYNLGEKNFTITEVKPGRAIDSQLEKLSLDEWEKIKTEATKNNALVWDSEIYRLEATNLIDEMMQLKVSTIPFSTRLGMNKYPTMVKQLGMLYAPLGLYTSCFIKTTDDYYIFIEKSAKYYTTRKLSFVGGILSKTEKSLHSGADLFNAVRDEIKEEVGVPKKDLEKLTCLAGYVTDNTNYCLVFFAKVTKSFAEVSLGFNKKHDGEAVKIIGVKQKDLPRFAVKLPIKDLPKIKILNLFIRTKKLLGAIS